MNEKQKREAAALRAAIEKAGRGSNGRVAPAVKDRVATWISERVAEGVQQRTMASALGVHESTVSAWLRARRRRRAAEGTGLAAPVVASAPAAMVEVRVTRRPSRTRSARPLIEGPNRPGSGAQELVLVDPSGVRIEGLDVASALAILRGLR